MKMQYKDRYSVLFILIVTLGFFGVTGTITSGFHFADDDEILKIVQDLAEKPFIDVAQKWITNDLSLRFRPFFYFHRVVESFFFGDNIFVWSVYTMILACLTFSLLYFGMRNLQFSALESLLFLVLIFCGTQMAIWWRLAHAEAIGMVFLSCCFFLATQPQKSFLFKNVLFSVCLIFLSWCKESFTIIVPAFILFKLWCDTYLLKISFRQAIKRNWILAIPFFVMMIDILIVFFVGTTKIGYAGVDSSLRATLKGIFSLLKGTLKEPLFLLLLFFAIVYYTIKSEKDFLQFLKPFAWPAIFALLIIAPNLVLYAKSGMWERYVLPTTVGIAFITVFFLRETKVKFHWLYTLFFIICLWSSLPCVRSMYSSAHQYTAEGYETNKLLTDLLRYTDQKSNILVVTDPGIQWEWNSLNNFLSVNKRSLYVLAPKKTLIENSFDSAWQLKFWESLFVNQQFSDMKGPVDVILFLDSGLINEIKKNVLNLSSYNNLYDSDFRFALLIKK